MGQTRLSIIAAINIGKSYVSHILQKLIYINLYFWNKKKSLILLFSEDLIKPKPKLSSLTSFLKRDLFMFLIIFL